MAQSSGKVQCCHSRLRPATHRSPESVQVMLVFISVLLQYQLPCSIPLQDPQAHTHAHIHSLPLPAPHAPQACPTFNVFCVHHHSHHPAPPSITLCPKACLTFETVQRAQRFTPTLYHAAAMTSAGPVRHPEATLLSAQPGMQVSSHMCQSSTPQTRPCHEEACAWP